MLPTGRRAAAQGRPPGARGPGICVEVTADVIDHDPRGIRFQPPSRPLVEGTVSTVPVEIPGAVAERGERVAPPDHGLGIALSQGRLDDRRVGDLRAHEQAPRDIREDRVARWEAQQDDVSDHEGRVWHVRVSLARAHSPSCLDCTGAEPPILPPRSGIGWPPAAARHQPSVHRCECSARVRGRGLARRAWAGG